MTGITISTELITPEKADQWLAKNTHNRTIRMNRAAAYAADMKAGNWLHNGETIKFGANGKLLDGQHRLIAISLSGVAVLMIVVRGLSEHIQDTIDTGMPRRFGDLLKLHGESNYASLASTVRGINSWERGVRRFGATGTAAATNAQLMETLNKYPWVREAMPLLGNVSYYAGLPTAVSGPLWWLFTSIDATDSDDFFQKLHTGNDLTEGHPVLALRRLLAVSRESKRMSYNLTFLAAVAIKAWNKYRLGEDVIKLSWRPGGANPEKFPEPK